MVELHIIFSIFILSILSFFDFIIFNEEILLTLCFLSFLFYCFNTLSESIFSSFEGRAVKFEQDLLLSFNIVKTTIISDFKTHTKLQELSSLFLILMCSLQKFLSECLSFLNHKPEWVYYQLCLIKLNELLVFNKSFIESFQKSCVIHLLYSIVLKKSSNNLTFLVSKSKATTVLTHLKFL